MKDENRSLNYDEDNEKNAPLTAANFRSILEVNKKSIEIYLEVEEQNEDIIKDLAKLSSDHKEIKDDLKDIDKLLFRLVVLLSLVSLGTLASIIKIIFGH